MSVLEKENVDRTFWKITLFPNCLFIQVKCSIAELTLGIWKNKQKLY